MPLSVRAALALLVLVAGTVRAQDAAPIRYPATPADSTVTDYHGTRIADPYRWLEDAGSAETIPSLRRVLDQVAGQVPLLIEIKSNRGQRVDALCLRTLLAELVDVAVQRLQHLGLESLQ